MEIALKAEDLANESDVEQKFIIPLLTAKSPAGLGYSFSDFKTKASLKKIVIDKGSANRKNYFPDYCIIANGLPVLIIEAKGPGEDLVEALREARLYATALNALFPHGLNPCEKVVAANSAQIIFGHWDAQDFHAVSIEAISAVDSSFTDFVGFASKSALEKRSYELLLKIKKNSQYYTPLQMMGGKNIAEESVGENSFGSNISVEFKYLFDPKTAEEREQLVRNAYVPSNQRASHVPQIDRLIRASVAPHLVDANLIPNTGDPTTLLSTLRTRQKPGELCLLIGDAGSGKSTFTDYVSSIALDKSVSNSTHWLHVNLNSAPLSRDAIYKWLTTEVLNGAQHLNPQTDFETLEFQRKIYRKQLGDLDKKRGALFAPDSIERANLINAELEKLEADRELTLKETLEHLYKATGKLLIVVLDNCDKRSGDDQLLMFDVATWLKNSFHCMVFLPLRDTTYDTYRDSPPLDTVVKDLVFRIDPPRLEQVIQKRLEYAARELAKDHTKFSYFVENGARVECAREEVGKYMSALVLSVFQNNRFKAIISGLAGRNIRKGIEILLEICRSGHIPEGEIWKARTVGGAHQFPSHLIMQILLKGKRKYYSDSATHLKNLFHSNEDDGLPDPFARLAILKWLENHKESYGPSRKKGIHKLETLAGELQSQGFSSLAIWRAVRDLAESDCIDAETTDLSEADLVGISLAGSVHLSLLEDSQYLAAVAEAVKFRTTQTATAIKDVMCGDFAFKAGSRESSLEIASLLTGYLADYRASYCPKPEALDPTQVVDLVGINRLRDRIEQQVENNRNLANYRRMTSIHPPGKAVVGEISAVTGHAVFVALPDNCEGFIWARAISTKRPPVVGMRLNFEIRRWNAERNRFELNKI